jgi:hypothetical protein
VKPKPKSQWLDKFIEEKDSKALFYYGRARKMRATIWLAALSSAMLTPAFAADKLPQVSFHYKDWEIVCDNTRTCRAAGYTAEDATHRASVLLTRRAGPDQPLIGELQLADEGDQGSGSSNYQMSIGGRPVGKILFDTKTGNATLTGPQTEALVAALLKNSPAVWRAGKTTWTLSNMGANAVFLKMDEFQGRLGTSGALIRKGSKSEAMVLPALPRPVITAVIPPKSLPAVKLTSAQQTLLLAELRKTTGIDDCENLGPDAREKPSLATHPLTRETMVVQMTCWMGAYNSGDGIWVANRRSPYAPRLVTNTATDYGDGEIFSSQKGRGIGDCMGSDAWTWNGQQFIHTASSSTGMCREIAAGGTWDLPTIVTEVRKQR